MGYGKGGGGGGEGEGEGGRKRKRWRKLVVGFGTVNAEGGKLNMQNR